MISKKEKPALLLVDIQKGFDPISYWGNESTILKLRKMQPGFYTAGEI